MANQLIKPLFMMCASLLVFQFSAAFDETVIDNCRESNNITQAEFDELVNQTSSEEDDMDSTPMKYKCFVHCMLNDLDLLDNDGFLDVEKIATMNSMDDSHREVINDCKRVHDVQQDFCIYAFNIITCLYDNLSIENESESE